MKKNKSPRPQIFSGEVMDNKMEKTAVIKITRRFPHPLYHRLVSRSKKYLVDCREIIVNVGDRVEIQNCRPFSRKKSWRVVKKLIKK